MTTALDAAVRIARQRGMVMKFSPSCENFAHLVIRTPGRITFVIIRYASRLYGTLREIEAEYRTTLGRIRSVPAEGALVRELWIYSRYGDWRYFRVGDVGLEEVTSTGDAEATEKSGTGGPVPTEGEPTDGMPVPGIPSEQISG